MNFSEQKINELIDLQKQYRKGIISEKDLSKEQIKELEILYMEQIKYLEKSIEKNKQQILAILRKNKKID